MIQEVGVLGGGAAGFFGAIQISNYAKDKTHITILEQSNEPLRKVKISGGGRCNVSHNLFDPELLSEKYPRGSKELRYAFEKFQPKDTIEWFQKRGVELKAEKDGRIFPISNSSSTIINCFLEESKKENIKVLLNTSINSISIREGEEKKFHLIDSNQKEYYFHKILIASGSNREVWNWLETLGHIIEKPVPSLFTLTIEDDRIKDLPGTSVPDGEIRILPSGKPQSGPILITHWGLSGPAVLRLSAWEARIFAESNYKVQIKVNWLGSVTGEEFLNQLQKVKKEFLTKKIISSPQGNITSRHWEKLIMTSGISPEKRWADISKIEMNKLKEEVTAAIYTVNGKGVFKDEFVTCGGVKRKEINFNTMQSKIIPGLYFAGEVIDIDGITGGFNFQNAWTTSTIAAMGMTGISSRT